MYDELKEIGLTDNEVKIYIALLELDTSTPAQISKKIGFSRSYVYDALERLQEKEIANTIFIKNKKHYQPLNPKLLIEQTKSKLERIEKIVPTLINLTKKRKGNLHVELHKGKYVYKTLLKDIVTNLKQNQEVLIFGIDDGVLSNLDSHYLTYLNIYFNKLEKKKIKEKIIIKKGSKKIKEAKTTEYRILPKKSIGNVAYEVYGDKVAIFLWGSPNHLILIENKEVAESYRKQFNILWNHAKK
ncbi:hypothetical protein CEE44_03520 [Candidatus Woesearchaeota archaeon B3_Woes]|nr:MAG: hypothetical protein CEE44_03520 [Candidatus Woesearchaeota archaeon B3_Woes]